MNHCVYILDTNILLHDPKSIFKFSDGICVIPFPVLAELDSFKKESTERGYSAREAIRLFDELRLQGNLVEGIPLQSGGFVKIYLIGTEFTKEKILADDLIIQSAIELKRQYEKVVLISKDFTLRIKASVLGITVEDYHVDVKVSKDNFYQGWKEFYVSSSDLKFNLQDVFLEVQKEYNFTTNEFLLLRSNNQEYYYRIFRYRGKNNFTEISLESKLLWGLEPHNPHQAMVIDMLLDDSLQLVILFGPSGTGKTFLVLATMIYKVLCAKVFEKLLISRPLVPLGPDIGYLPGDLQEKLQIWMQPIKDNMELLLHMINQNGGGCPQITPANNSFNGEMKKKKMNREPGGGSKIMMDDLLGKGGKVCLEAITYMRGRSIPLQAIFIDEVQNLTPHEVKTLISRAGEGSKIILAGDPYQIDSPYLDFASNGLVVASECFKGQDIFGTVYLQTSERSLLSSLANSLM
jgi:PhoH-like ATPase